MTLLHTPAVQQSVVGVTPSGTTLHAFDIRSAGGSRLTVLNLGAILNSWMAPDRTGRLDNIVLGFDRAERYLRDSPYFGAVVGRYANRIAQARFSLAGKGCTLSANDGVHSLHGGQAGFDKRVWEATPFTSRRGAGVRLRLTSPDGDQGFPGTLRVLVRYLLTHDNQLVIDYQATTTRPTVVNLSQHSYFNLGGPGCPTIREHLLQVNADHYTPVDATLIPTGELVPVADTPFDFRTATPIGARIESGHPQMATAGGYDHNLVLRREGGGLAHAARLTDPASGRTLDVHTTEPGLQLYTSNFMDGSLHPSQGRTFGKYGGVCLETQHFPDGPNQPSFPNTTLLPHECYRSRTIYALSVAAK